ncbi:MAG: SagB/ThcOx family dehydrogenase [Cruoricaptor ignavus]|nr:SagB/ThcOx family dehydrogenase [Cruoricaptor ignavus]
MNISHNFIIYFKNNKPILFNYKNKKEYNIRKEYLKTLINYSDSDENLTDEHIIIRDFLMSDVFTEENNIEKPYLHYHANIFHNISKDTSVTMSDSTEEEWANQYIEVCKRIRQEPLPKRLKSEDFKTVIYLPKPEELALKLLDTLKRRKTVREFEEEEVDIKQLSNLLFYTFGYIHGEEEEYGEFRRRSSPSGGCLQIIEPYITVFNVSGIENGVYWYDPEKHSICKVSDDFTYQDLRECLAGQFFGNNCSFGIFFAANLEILAWKYKTSRNYKVVFLEAGHFSQTSQLVAVTQSLNTWITGAFTESSIERLCKMDGIKKIPVFFTAYGRGELLSMHSIMRKKVNENLTNN